VNKVIVPKKLEMAVVKMTVLASEFSCGKIYTVEEESM